LILLAVDMCLSLLEKLIEGAKTLFSGFCPCFPLYGAQKVYSQAHRFSLQDIPPCLPDGMLQKAVDNPSCFPLTCPSREEYKLILVV
jgi:hypothetical protein